MKQQDKGVIVAQALPLELFMGIILLGDYIERNVSGGQ
jgi:hypothetical protein